jgi:hypothetical protein
VTKKNQISAFMLVAVALVLVASGVGAAVTSTPGTPTSPAVFRSAKTGPAATNLIVTPAVRKSLFDADVKAHSYPISDYKGLAKGVTYYAYDAQNGHYYAAAGLVPNSKSLDGQVSTQDDGGYDLFFRARNATKWSVFNDGLGGAEDSICPIVIPVAVRKVWNWTMHACYPNTPS